jgi:hypothetical protein
MKRKGARRSTRAPQRFCLDRRVTERVLVMSVPTPVSPQYYPAYGQVTEYAAPTSETIGVLSFRADTVYSIIIFVLAAVAIFSSAFAYGQLSNSPDAATRQTAGIFLAILIAVVVFVVFFLGSIIWRSLRPTFAAATAPVPPPPPSAVARYVYAPLTPAPTYNPYVV